jgi:hypothetical protein
MSISSTKRKEHHRKTPGLCERLFFRLWKSFSTSKLPFLPVCSFALRFPYKWARLLLTFSRWIAWNFAWARRPRKAA